MVSFEIPLILSLLGVVMLTGSLNLSEIAASQSSFPWIVFLPIGAIVFFITMLAELERIPFDLPEAESEIVAGWLTELSGMMYGLVQLGTYLKLYAFAASVCSTYSLVVGMDQWWYLHSQKKFLLMELKWVQSLQDHSLDCLYLHKKC